MSVRNIFADESHDIYTVRTHADGPDGELPLTAEMLINRPSGDLFGMTMNAGMGWSPDELDRDGILLLSTLGGLRGADGKPVALALHQGHYELDIQIKAAAEVIKANHACPMPCTSPILVTGVLRVQRGCLIRYHTEMTHRW